MFFRTESLVIYQHLPHQMTPMFVLPNSLHFTSSLNNQMSQHNPKVAHLIPKHVNHIGTNPTKKKVENRVEVW